MPGEERIIYVLGGPNGSGKTTSAFSIVPNLSQAMDYVNADTIAAGLSQFHPERVAIQAGRLMLKKIRELLEQQHSFAFETTMASRSFITLLNKAKSQGYRIVSIYLWLRTVDLAIQRVAARVAAGGHNIPEEDIRRRYRTGLRNFFNLYQSVSDEWFLFDSSEEAPQLIAKRVMGKETQVINQSAWKKVTEQRNG